MPVVLKLNGFYFRNTNDDRPLPMPATIIEHLADYFIENVIGIHIKIESRVALCSTWQRLWFMFYIVSLSLVPFPSFYFILFYFREFFSSSSSSFSFSSRLFCVVAAAVVHNFFHSSFWTHWKLIALNIRSTFCLGVCHCAVSCSMVYSFRIAHQKHIGWIVWPSLNVRVLHWRDEFVENDIVPRRRWNKTSFRFVRRRCHHHCAFIVHALTHAHAVDNESSRYMNFQFSFIVGDDGITSVWYTTSIVCKSIAHSVFYS